MNLDGLNSFLEINNTIINSEMYNPSSNYNEMEESSYFMGCLNAVCTNKFMADDFSNTRKYRRAYICGFYTFKKYLNEDNEPFTTEDIQNLKEFNDPYNYKQIKERLSYHFGFLDKLHIKNIEEYECRFGENVINDKCHYAWLLGFNDGSKYLENRIENKNE